MRPTRILATAIVTAVVVGGLTVAPAAQAAGKRPAPDFTRTIREGRTAARAALKETDATSASVAFVAGGKTVWSQTFGKSGVSGKKPPRRTMYGTGSVGKVVTTVAIMQLVDAGRVALDAPVVRYVPDFSMADPQYRQITVRMLLNHSAGLPGTDYSDGLSSQPLTSYEDRVLQGLRTSRLKTTPGAMNVYCNDCFTLAGLVVERVAGMPFEDYVTARILDPLRMRHSQYVTSLPLPRNIAPVIQKGKVDPFQVPNVLAAGGLMSTAKDMARLAMVFTGDGVVGGRRILSRAAVQEMAVDQTTSTLRTAPPGGFRYGLGWDTVQDPALKSAGVRGWTKGGDVVQYHAAFMVAPDQGLAVVVEGAGLTFSSTSAETIGGTILLNALVESGAIPALPQQLSTDPPARDKPTRKQIKRSTGIYLAHNTSLKVSKGKRRSLVVSQLVDGRWDRLPGRNVRRRDGAFWATKTPGVSITTVRAWDRTYLVRRAIGGTGTYRTPMTLAQRVRPGGSLSPAWRKRVGSRWLLANENPSSENWTLDGPPGVEITDIPGLSGYLIAKGALVSSVPFDATASRSVGSMFLEVPLLMGRDMYDFTFPQADGRGYLTFASSVLRSAASVPRLVPGRTTVTIGSEGYVQWYRVPRTSTLTLRGQSDWKLFDKEMFDRQPALLDSGEAATTRTRAPAGSYLAVFGPAGRRAVVTMALPTPSAADPT